MLDAVDKQYWIDDIQKNKNIFPKYHLTIRPYYDKRKWIFKSYVRSANEKDRLTLVKTDWVNNGEFKNDVFHKMVLEHFNNVCRNIESNMIMDDSNSIIYKTLHSED